MRRVLVAIGVLLAAAVLFAAKLVYDAGELNSLSPHFAGQCRRVAGVVGAEDIAIDRERGLVFLSAMDRRAAAAGRSPSGGVYLYDLRSPAAPPVELTARFTASTEFRPLGLSLLRSAAGERILFVVNRRLHNRSVELFDVRGRRLVHRETIPTAAVGTLNDIQAVGERAFYATQDHGARTRLGTVLEEYLRLPWSAVVYYDGKRFRTAADGIRYANGIALSPDGRHLYVGATTGKSVRVYARDPTSGELKFERRIELPMGVDNLDVDQRGNLWVAGHPKLLTFTRYAAGKRPTSPSMVVRIGAPTSSTPHIEQVFVDDGTLLSASSAAAARGNMLVIGTVLDDHFLVCRRADRPVAPIPRP